MALSSSHLHPLFLGDSPTSMVSPSSLGASMLNSLPRGPAGSEFEMLALEAPGSVQRPVPSLELLTHTSIFLRGQPGCPTGSSHSPCPEELIVFPPKPALYTFSSLDDGIATHPGTHTRILRVSVTIGSLNPGRIPSTACYVYSSSTAFQVCSKYSD